MRLRGLMFDHNVVGNNLKSQNKRRYYTGIRRYQQWGTLKLFIFGYLSLQCSLRPNVVCLPTCLPINLSVVNTMSNKIQCIVCTFFSIYQSIISIYQSTSTQCPIRSNVLCVPTSLSICQSFCQHNVL